MATYTEAYWKIDLHNLLHFLALRMDSHAQLEIRQYATTLGEQIVAPLFPIVWEAFLDYRMQSTFLTRLDSGVIQRLTANAAAAGTAPPFSDADFMAAQDATWVSLNRSRERDECRSKLQRLGLIVGRDGVIWRLNFSQTPKLELSRDLFAAIGSNHVEKAKIPDKVRQLHVSMSCRHACYRRVCERSSVGRATDF